MMTTVADSIRCLTTLILSLDRALVSAKTAIVHVTLAGRFNYGSLNIDWLLTMAKSSRNV